MTASAHQVFEALGDPVRLQIVERLGRGPLPTVEAVSGLGISRQAATKHLRVLERAGLVTSTVQGRVILREFHPERLSVVQTWMDRHAKMWSKKLDALAEFVERDSGG